MQYLHRMQRSYLWSTRPSSLLYVASTGQTGTQGGFSQWLQMMGIMLAFTFGYSPSVYTVITLFQRGRRFFAYSSGVEDKTLFSALHAITQAWHPIHLSRSIIIAYFTMISPHAFSILTLVLKYADMPVMWSYMTPVI